MNTHTKIKKEWTKDSEFDKKPLMRKNQTFGLGYPSEIVKHN